MQVSKLAYFIGAKGEEYSRHQASPPASGEFLYQQITSKGREDETKENEKVVGQDGIAGDIIDRGGQNSHGEHVFRICQDITAWIHNVSMEKVGGVSKYGFRIPGDYPGIEKGVAFKKNISLACTFHKPVV